jgi:nitrite reductase/ring-hydroxylating ferredoxin subunit
VACRERLICESVALRDGEDGVRFTVTRPGGEAPAFAVRFGGRVYAFLNRCAHVPIELDWVPGRFFDDSRRYLICATHGAMYEPRSGHCVAGPCRGARLGVVPVVEHDGAVFLMSDDER